MESIPSTTTFVKQNEVNSIESLLPFQVVFPVKQMLGKSNKKPSVDVVTQKFYSKESELVCSEQELARQLEKLKIRGPREKYELPYTENQSYGWYEMKGVEKNSLFCFAKTTSQFVIEHLMNYAKIRD